MILTKNSGCFPKPLVSVVQTRCAFYEVGAELSSQGG
jgi:hypothetical protein